jgi:hypothetical protein
MTTYPSRRLLLLATLGAVLLVVLAVTLIGNGKSVNEPTAEMLKTTPVVDGNSGQLLDTMAALRRELALLRADVSSVKSRLNTIENRESNLVSNKHPDSPPPEQVAEEGSVDPMAKAEEEHAAHLEALEAGFQAEQAEGAWANETRASIQNIFAADGKKDGGKRPELQGTTLNGAECRATMCKIEVSHTDRKALMGFMSGFHGTIGNDLPRMGRSARLSIYRAETNSPVGCAERREAYHSSYYSVPLKPVFP